MGVAALLAAGVLAGCGSAQSAVAAPAGCGCADREEPEPAAPSRGSNNGLVIIDNSGADSWLEVDRTLNTLLQSQGTAGSDHDGDGGDVRTDREPAGHAAQQTASGGDG
ncbi:hypothetical protein [Actinacidiphila paucisporea]|uniref:hypothetical protein n=1 Tax=Actinacidiphila paucisporea TaxID=310782 RepID=UPI001160F031|nr:hypothetical protein [Actinacidiphila paucisporea]